MSRSISALFVLLLTFGWFWFSWKWYTCWLMNACETGPSTEIVDTPDEPEVELKRYPIDFKWSDPTAFTNSGFETYKQQVLDGLTDDNRLEIVGLYFEGEASVDTFENIGLARAEKMKALFSPPIPDDRILIRARIVEAPDNAENIFFQAANFNWMEGERKSVEELEDRIIIRFAINSTQMTYDPAVDTYLEKLSKRISQTGEKVSLTGHTDSVGTPEENLRLGENRAMAVKEILVGKGVDPSQVSVASKGESQPVATNSTPEGKQDNRRVEVVLQKEE